MDCRSLSPDVVVDWLSDAIVNTPNGNPPAVEWVRVPAGP